MSLFTETVITESGYAEYFVKELTLSHDKLRYCISTK